MEAMKAGFGLASLVGGPCVVVVRNGRPHIRTYQRHLANGMTREQAVASILQMRIAGTEAEMRRILNTNLFSVGSIDRSPNRFWISGA